MLEQLGPDIWIADGGIVSFFGFDYPTRMAVVRLEDGGLWVWSPIALTTELEQEVRALGPVRHLVSPNKLHHLFLGAWKANFPEAKRWGPPSTVARFADLGFSGTLTDDAPPDWAGQLDQYYFDNSRFLDELIFFHRKSRTAIIADLSQPFSAEFLEESLAVVAALAREVRGDDRGPGLPAVRSALQLPPSGSREGEGPRPDRRGTRTGGGRAWRDRAERRHGLPPARLFVAAVAESGANPRRRRRLPGKG